MASHSTRKGKGRQKTKLEKIENEFYRQVTFSKRRNGLFKKAFDLSIMTKAEIAIILYSSSGKVYSFAHPGLEIVVNKFLTGNPQPMSYMHHQIEIQRDRVMTRKITELETTENVLEAEMKHGKDLGITLAQYRDQHWGAPDNLGKLMQLIAALKNLMANVKREIETRDLVGQQNNGLRSPTSRGLPAFPRSNVCVFGEGNGSSGGIYCYSGNWSMNNGPRSSTGSGITAFPRLNGYEFGEGSGSTGDVYPCSDGQSSLNGHSSFDPPFFPYTHRLNVNEGGQGGSTGGGSFYGGASGWLSNAGSGFGLLNTNGASSSRGANNDDGSIDGVPGSDDVMPSHGFGVDFRYGSI